MSLSDLAALGSFVSGFAVLVSLTFLYFQLRQITEQVKQAERNQRAALDQGHLAAAGVSTWRLAESPYVELQARVTAGDTKFTAEELARLQAMFHIAMLTLRDAYLQHKSGLMDSTSYNSALLAIRTYWLVQPVYRALWRRAAASVDPQFRSVIDTIVSDAPLAKPTDATSRFEADLAAVMAAAH